MGVDELVKTLQNIDFDILKKKVFPDKLEIVKKKLANPYECFNSIDDYHKPVIITFKTEYFFSESKNSCPSDEKK